MIWKRIDENQDHKGKLFRYQFELESHQVTTKQPTLLVRIYYVCI